MTASGKDFQDQIGSALYSQFQQYQPVQFLLKEENKTKFARVYLNKKLTIDPKLPWIVIIFAASGTGKGMVMEALKKSGLVQFAKTAVSRSIRPGESPDTHIWMRQQRHNETSAEYIKNLIIEYDLMEHDLHNGNLYGLPKTSLEEAFGKGRVVLMECGIAGVVTLQQKCQNLANIMAVFLVPDSFEQLWSRMGDRDNKKERLKKALAEVRGAPDVANFYIHNSEIPDNTGKSGLEIARDGLTDLVREYCYR